MKITSFFCLFFKPWFWESCMRTQCKILSCSINFQSVIKKKVTFEKYSWTYQFFQGLFSYVDAGIFLLCWRVIKLTFVLFQFWAAKLVSDFVCGLPCFPALVSFITWNSETFLRCVVLLGKGFALYLQTNDQRHWFNG